MIDRSNFFIEENSISYIPDEAYEALTLTFEDINAYARTIHKSVYLIDYYKKTFAYVSDNPLFLCGLTPNEVKNMGFEFYIHHCPKEDLEMLLEINKAGFSFLSSLPLLQRKDHIISYDFRILDSKQEVWWINHQLTPYRLTKGGKIWLALCAVSFSSRNAKEKVEILKNGSHNYWVYDFKSKVWRQNQLPELSDKEKKVLMLSAMGYTMGEIGMIMKRSLNTVKAYRKDILEKLEVDNISEAIVYVMNHRLI